MHKQLAFSLVGWSLPRSALQLSIACAPEHSFHLTGVVKFMHIRASARPRELHTKCEEISHSLHLLCKPATAENILAHTKRHSSEKSKRRSWWHRQNLVQFFVVVVVVILHLLLLFFSLFCFISGEASHKCEEFWLSCWQLQCNMEKITLNKNNIFSSIPSPHGRTLSTDVEDGREREILKNQQKKKSSARTGSFWALKEINEFMRRDCARIFTFYNLAHAERASYRRLRFSSLSQLL